ncbi:branched-chain amino acid aminotransferase/4-amino-4-deoxychorismate lyase [Cyanobium sp. Copco_Reservoir_LC18]|uniref:aminotransferase class IV n=1 Tax=Cyanobium sp. Copco_Reservoir_LC18 TaxID=1328305 RepID=UPI001358D487|nr:aminotransferase class IV [Cyanobium sp. Copco_Reservoir_LC18]KAF0654858.1 branched-chain amino acid aminotransferase/4-amino-4-deoxychorismate lyase [Cyanobium sp. Copco_Reservoir_LC18]
MSGGPAPAGRAIAWIDGPTPEGTWGDPDRLCLPLSDRGLLLADGLFETLLVEGGEPRLLAEHLERWRGSAACLGMAPPPGADRVRPLLAEAMARSGLTGSGALRLNWSRGSGAGRGLALPGPDEPQGRPRFWLQLSPWRPASTPVAVVVSGVERRNAASLISRCKTFAYAGAIQALREARAAGADDALLLGSGGDLCCGTSANLLVRRGGAWVTPPLESGCLPGVMRGRGLALGLVREERLSVADLLESEAALLVNSLGGRPIRRCGAIDLPVPAGALDLWRRLLLSS